MTLYTRKIPTESAESRELAKLLENYPSFNWEDGGRRTFGVNVFHAKSHAFPISIYHHYLEYKYKIFFNGSEALSCWNLKEIEGYVECMAVMGE